MAQRTSTLEVGATAPAFELNSHLGSPVKLSDYAGTNVVIAFYPFAFSGT